MLAIRRAGRMVRPLFFDWLARLRRDTTSNWKSPIGNLKFSFGGVLDSTLGWSAPLPVESRGSLVKLPAKQINGKTEEMPLAA